MGKGSTRPAHQARVTVPPSAWPLSPPAPTAGEKQCEHRDRCPATLLSDLSECKCSSPVCGEQTPPPTVAGLVGLPGPGIASMLRNAESNAQPPAALPAPAGLRGWSQLSGLCRPQAFTLEGARTRKQPWLRFQSRCWSSPPGAPPPISCWASRPTPKLVIISLGPPVCRQLIAPISKTGRP